jgi:hypothetical protein
VIRVRGGEGEEAREVSSAFLTRSSAQPSELTFILLDPPLLFVSLLQEDLTRHKHLTPRPTAGTSLARLGFGVVLIASRSGPRDDTGHAKSVRAVVCS